MLPISLDQKRAVLAKRFPTIDLVGADPLDIAAAYDQFLATGEDLPGMRADTAAVHAREMKRLENLWRELPPHCAKAS